MVTVKTEGGKTRTLWVYDQLKAMIMDNRLQVGAAFLEVELAEKLGVSRTPLREAALRLQAEGFVTIKPRQGIRIRPISATDMEEIYDILTELEPYAVRRLADGGLEAEQERRLRRSVDQMEDALSNDDLDGWAAADSAFHQDLVDFAGNLRLRQIVSSLWEQVHRARMATLGQRPDLSRSNEDHRRLLDLIVDGKAEAAEMLHRAHRSRARASLGALLRGQEDEGL